MENNTALVQFNTLRIGEKFSWLGSPMVKLVEEFRWYENGPKYGWTNCRFLNDDECYYEGDLGYRFVHQESLVEIELPQYIPLEVEDAHA